MIDLSWNNIVHSNMLNFLILAIALYFLLKDKVKNAVDSMTEKTIKTVNDSVSDKENALKTLEETKLEILHKIPFVHLKKKRLMILKRLNGLWLKMQQKLF